MKSVALLDGGLGQEIYRRAYGTSSPLWSVAVMLEQPEVVSAVHEAFIRAGAKTLTLNTYAATPTRLRNEDASSQMVSIYEQAFRVLQQAIGTTGAVVDIAGCLPPLTGSYRGAPDRSFASLRDEYAIMVDLQAAADVLLIETMTNTREAVAASDAAASLNKPFGVAFRLEGDGRLKSGETLAEAVAAVEQYAPTAVMLNCCEPELLTASMQELVTLYPRAGGYANAFKSVETVAAGDLVDTLEAREDTSPETYAAHVRQWLDAGADAVGGCCEITPAHIRYLTETLGEDMAFVRFSQLE